MAPISESADKVFLALGQTLYACQLFEATMLEVLAHAHELLDGSGDGQLFQQSIDTLSRRTLGQLLHSLRKRADLRDDIDARLGEGLEARNFIVHGFASYAGDAIAEEANAAKLQKVLNEKCVIVMAANDAGLVLLNALGKSNSARSAILAEELERKAQAIRAAAAQNLKREH